MTAFRYSARRPTGDLVSGDAQAPNRTALKAQLARQGLLLVEAQPVRRRGLPSLAPARVALPSLLGFLREFRHLIDAGLPQARALQLLKDRPGDPVLSAAVGALHAGVARGLSLDAAAAERRDVFDDIVRATLSAGVRTSRLGEALARLETFLTLRAEMARKIRRAMVYPTFLIGLLALVLAGLMLIVLPRFADLYAEFGADLPLPTRILMQAVETAPIWIPTTLLTLVAATLLWRGAMRRPALARRRDAWALQTPVIGPIIRGAALVQISYMLAMLLRAGAPLKEALEFVTEAMSNQVIRARLADVSAGIAAGRSLSDGLDETRLFPPTAQSMIRAGETSGALANLLDAVAKVQEDQVEDRIDRLLALIEPAMSLIVGGVLGAVSITGYLPVFGISGGVQ